MKYYCKIALGIIIGIVTLCGCAGSVNGDPVSESNFRQEDTAEEQGNMTKEQIAVPDGQAEIKGEQSDVVSDLMEVSEKALHDSKKPEPEIVDMDWSDYFDDLNGAAVIYDASDKKYMIYNRELAMTRRSPCSTFKIISSLIALENGIIEPDHSVHTWSGEIFWNENWNRDIGFREAFHTSCVWYFREIVNETGPELIQTELDKLQYGNCDISDWEGHLNTNNNNPALTGFWIESSLMISPKEQTEVMERIFGTDSVYTEKTRKELKQVMLVSEQDEADLPIYGKTGMGKDSGVVVDAWFTGFAERAEGNLYYCVYLGRTDHMDVSSARAKEIAIRLVSDLMA